MTIVYTYNKLNKIYEGDGSGIREQLVYAGLLLMLFENFKDYTINQIDGLYSSDSQLKEGKLIHKRGEKFKKLIKEYGKGGSGQHGNEAFRAGLKWFHDSEAITSEELEEVERLYILRNDIGHELFLIIADDNKTAIKIEDILTVLDIYTKIARWWVKEIEIPTNPNFNQENDIDLEDISTVNLDILKIIIKKAVLGNMDINEILKAGKKATETS